MAVLALAYKVNFPIFGPRKRDLLSTDQNRRRKVIMKRINLARHFSWLVFISFAMLLLATPPKAQGDSPEIVLKAISAWDKTYHQSASLLHFMDLVNKKGEGKIQIQWAGGPELIKGQNQLDALGRGVIDIIDGSPDYFFGEVPAGAIMEMGIPAGVITFQSEYRIFHSGIWQRLDKIYQKKANAKLLGFSFSLPFHIFTAKKKIEHQKDLAGLTVRTFGGCTDVFVKALGASPVRIASGEVYLSLKTGTVDGALRSAVALQKNNEWEVLNYGLDFPIAIRGDAYHLMNLDKWNSLPKNIQDLLMECQRETEQFMSKQFAPKLQKKALSFLKGKGMVFTRFPKGEDEQYTEVVSKSIKDYFISKTGNEGRELVDILMAQKK